MKDKRFTMGKNARLSFVVFLLSLCVSWNGVLASENIEHFLVDKDSIELVIATDIPVLSSSVNDSHLVIASLNSNFTDEIEHQNVFHSIETNSGKSITSKSGAKEANDTKSKNKSEERANFSDDNISSFNRRNISLENISPGHDYAEHENLTSSSGLMIQNLTNPSARLNSNETEPIVLNYPHKINDTTLNSNHPDGQSDNRDEEHAALISESDHMEEVESEIKPDEIDDILKHHSLVKAELNKFVNKSDANNEIHDHDRHVTNPAPHHEKVISPHPETPEVKPEMNHGSDELEMHLHKENKLANQHESGNEELPFRFDDIYYSSENHHDSSKSHHDSSKSHHNSTQHSHTGKHPHGGQEHFPLVTIDFERVKLPVIISAWIFLAMLAKIGELYNL